MSSRLIVFKFGGSSLKNANGVKNVMHILKAYKGKHMVIVVSAMGKTTNALEKVVKLYMEKDPTRFQALKEVKTFHYDILKELFSPNHDVFKVVDIFFEKIKEFIAQTSNQEYDFIYDQIIFLGEMMSSIIVSHYLKENELPVNWIDAREVIITDDIYREGWVNWQETNRRVKELMQPNINTHQFVLTQGFIASNQEGYTTTLGREGSDYSAAIFSFCLDAAYMAIWKDVPGVLTADPRLFNNVEKLDRLSYKEAIEMTYYGAKVIHPKTIKPLQNKSIPLFVKSFIEPEGSGTLISDEVEDLYPPMVAVEKEQALMQISTRDFSFVAEHHMSRLFKEIADLRIQVNLMQNTAISFSICVNDIDDKVDQFMDRIQDTFKVMINRDLQLITVRHYTNEVIDNLKKGKMVLTEEKTGKTVQMVVKDIPVMEWK
ncbi:MAG: aspartate kinase [Bacteroidota bacterium]